MSTVAFSTRLIAGQEAIFFGYPRGLNVECAVNASEAKEMIKKAANVRTCTEIMTLKANGVRRYLRTFTHRWALLCNIANSIIERRLG
jgi:hypothetical protein